MKTESGNSFDSNSDLYEIGLMAAALPGFPDAMLRALLAAGESVKPASEPDDASKTKAAA